MNWVWSETTHQNGKYHCMDDLLFIIFGLLCYVTLTTVLLVWSKSNQSNRGQPYSNTSPNGECSLVWSYSSTYDLVMELSVKLTICIAPIDLWTLLINLLSLWILPINLLSLYYELYQIIYYLYELYWIIYYLYELYWIIYYLYELYRIFYYLYVSVPQYISQGLYNSIISTQMSSFHWPLWLLFCARAVRSST